MTRARSNGNVGIRRRLSRALIFAGMVLVTLLLLATPVDAARRPPFPFPDPGEDTTTTTTTPTTTTPTTTTPTTTTPTTTTPTTTRPRQPVTTRPPATTRPVVTTRPAGRNRPVTTTRSSGTKGSTATNSQTTKAPSVQGFGATSPTTARGKKKSSSTTVTPDASGVLLPTGSAAAADPATPAGTDPLVQVQGRSVTRNKGVPVQLVATDQGGDDNSLIVGAAGVVGVVLIGSLGFVLRSTRRPDSH